jgi:hypothetical protein
MLRVAELGLGIPRSLLARFGLQLTLVDESARIPGTFWGEPEAGIIGSTVFVRADTPVHSLLHEACHIICMTAVRRAGLERDAGGDDIEEAAVCYLQVLLADCLPGVGRKRLMQDMDDWGYSFRLGSTARWFSEDATDACAWLEEAGLCDDNQPVFRLRQ